tara:strand:- start:1411 stop:3159 length:1749 start_codon:yes stop_codon:yes gene_type:complete
MKRIECSVDGMTCNSCEVLIERKLQKLEGVRMVVVSLKDKLATIECDEELEFSKLQDALTGKGYTLHELDEEPNLVRKGNKLFSAPRGKLEEIGAVLLVLLAVYVLVTQLNLLPERIGVQDGMSLGFVFVIGLVAATSTCLAVAGGLLLAVAQKYNEKYPNITGWQKFKPHVSFNIGRIISYTLLGGAIGALGSMIAITPMMTGIITILASLLMIIMGLQLLGIFPWLSSVQLKMPKFIAHRIYGSSEKKNSAGMVSSFLFGGATFFLPCGFTQALQLYVLGSGNFMTGALTMLAFSLGTLPSLAGIGAFTSFVKKGDWQKRFMTFSAVLVIILGLWNVPNGLALTGSTFSFGSGDSSEAELGVLNVEIVDGVQIAEMDVIRYDYYPSEFTVLSGMPVEWRIDGSEAAGCGRVITAPELGITEYLSSDEITVIEFTPGQIGKIEFSCTMGMMTPGAGFTVIESPDSGSDNSAEEEFEHEPIDENAVAIAEPVGDYQEMFMEVSYAKGYYPDVHYVEAGVPVKWTIDTINKPGGCMGTLVIPDLGVVHNLEVGETVFEFWALEAGEYFYTCSMGSVLGKIIAQ